MAEDIVRKLFRDTIVEQIVNSLRGSFDQPENWTKYINERANRIADDILEHELKYMGHYEQDDENIPRCNS